MRTLKQWLKNFLKIILPYRVQADIHRIFLSKLFNRNYSFEIKEAKRISRDLRKGNIKKVLIVYDNLTAPPSYGDHLITIMFARFFISRRIPVSYVIVDGEYRSDWSNLNQEEIQNLIVEYEYTANLLLDKKLATIEVITSMELETKVKESIDTGTDIPFRDSVINRIATYNHMLNTLGYLSFKSSKSSLDYFLLSFNELAKKVSYKKPKQQYITWHIRHSEKWGFDRNLSYKEFLLVYERLLQLYPNHLIVIVSDITGCDHYRKIVSQDSLKCVFSKDYSDTIMGDGVLILGSDYFFALRGGGISVFPIFSQLPYEQVVAPTNQALWRHERLTSWASNSQIFRRPFLDKNILPTSKIKKDNSY